MNLYHIVKFLPDSARMCTWAVLSDLQVFEHGIHIGQDNVGNLVWPACEWDKYGKFSDLLRGHACILQYQVSIP